MIGGSINKKKTSGVKVDGGSCSEVQNKRNPITIPTTISKQDSGKIWWSFGVIWKPEKKVRLS